MGRCLNIFICALVWAWVAVGNGVPPYVFAQGSSVFSPALPSGVATGSRYVINVGERLDPVLRVPVVVGEVFIEGPDGARKPVASLFGQLMDEGRTIYFGYGDTPEVRTKGLFSKIHEALLEEFPGDRAILAGSIYRRKCEVPK